MNDHELDHFEKELEALKPSRPPQSFSDRLSRTIASQPTRSLDPALDPNLNLNRNQNPPSPPRIDFKQFLDHLRRHLRWLVPATVVMIAGLVLLRSDILGVHLDVPAVEPRVALKADDVKIDSTLVSSFDAVANTPGGEPVRFRCEEWMDEVRLKDSSRGLVYSQRVPRVTVVPVRFETY
jgi:hypothetical protein